MFKDNRCPPVPVVHQASPNSTMASAGLWVGYLCNTAHQFSSGVRQKASYCSPKTLTWVADFNPQVGCQRKYHRQQYLAYYCWRQHLFFIEEVIGAGGKKKFSKRAKEGMESDKYPVYLQLLA